MHHLNLAARTVAATNTTFVDTISMAIALARRNSRATADTTFVNDLAAVCLTVASGTGCSEPTTHTTPIFHIPCAVALARGNAGATAHLCVCVCARALVCLCVLESITKFHRTVSYFTFEDIELWSPDARHRTKSLSIDQVEFMSQFLFYHC